MDEYLQHHGILGMKWGIRRYQNTDGSLTAEGKKRRASQGTDKPISKRAARKKALKEAKAAYKSSSDTYLRQMKAGERFAAFMLLGVGGSRNVANYRAAGYSRGKAFVRAYFDKEMTDSYVYQRALSKHAVKKAAKRSMG